MPITIAVESPNTQTSGDGRLGLPLGSGLHAFQHCRSDLFAQQKMLEIVELCTAKGRQPVYARSKLRERGSRELRQQGITDHSRDRARFTAADGSPFTFDVSTCPEAWPSTS